VNSYKCSDGSRLKQSVIERLISKAKAQKVKQQFEDSGYNFCEQCGISNGTYIDCSHNVSVKESKETGRTELSFDVNNITMLCRNCHKIKDKLL
jgi:predicted HNH restriction endonuclease